jgi:UDP-N-acetylmuramoyl-tripeptide--D-alanyl-D-alanine ligase
MNLTLSEIIKVTNGNLVYGEDTEVIGFTRNTKEINPGDVFIGLKGNTDGSMFYLDALKNGAKGVIVNKGAIDKYEFKEGTFILEVDDTLKALGQIASLKRSKYNIPVVAITGSVGKTSTSNSTACTFSAENNIIAHDKKNFKNIFLIVIKL